MDHWLFLNYVAKLEAEDRVRQLDKEPVKIASFDWSWLKSFVRNITNSFS
jgi:hypothetical protein